MYVDDNKDDPAKPECSASAVRMRKLSAAKALTYLSVGLIAIVASVFTFIMAATYVIQKDPELVVNMLSSLIGQTIELETLEVSYTTVGPKVVLGQLEIKSDKEALITMNQASVTVNAWSILFGQENTLEDIKLKGVNVALPRSDATRKSTESVEKETYELVSNLFGKSALIGSVHLEDLALRLPTTPPLTIEVPNARVVSEKDRVELNANIRSSLDEGIVSIKGFLIHAPKAKELLIFQGTISGESVFVPLPYLSASEIARAPSNKRTNQMEVRSGFAGIKLDALSIPVLWKLSPELILVASEPFHIKGPAINANGSLFLSKTPETDVPHLTIDSNADHVDPFLVLTTLPPELLGTAANQWLAKQIKKARVNRVHFQLDYPEVIADDAPENSLNLEIEASDAQIATAPGWPDVLDAQASVKISRNNLFVEAAAGSMGGLPIEGTTVEIPTFKGDTNLLIKAAVDSPIQNIIAFLNTSPIGPSLNTFSDYQIDGQAKGLFKGNFNLSKASYLFDVQSNIDVARVKTPFLAEAITAIRGEIKVNQERITVPSISGQLGKSTVNGSMIYDFATEVVKGHVNGRLDSRTLATETGKTAASWFSGATDIDSDFLVTPERYRFAIHSNTKGLAINLPTIVDKAAEKAAPLVAEAKGTFNGEQQVSVELKDFISAKGSAFPTATNLFNRAGGYLVRHEEDRPILPGQFTVDLGHIQGHALFDEQREVWNIDVAKLDLSALDLESSNVATANENASPTPSTPELADETQITKSSSLDPRKVPSFHILCKEFRLGKKIQGDFEIDAQHDPTGLMFRQFDINMGVLSMYNVEGAWTQTDSKEQTTVMRGTIKLRDTGLLLKNLGIYEDLRDAQGMISYHAQWNGAPYAVNPTNLAMNADLAVENATIKKTRSEAIRFMDLLTLNMLDISDDDLVLSKVKGHLVYKNGLVTTEDTDIDLPSATLFMKGNANILAQTIDSKVTMQLKVTRIINTIGLAIANPFLGIGYLGYEQGSNSKFTYFDRFTKRTYKIVGSWHDPKIVAEGFDLIGKL